MVDIFQDRIDFYSGLDNFSASQHADDIEATFLMYNNVVATAEEHDKEFSDKLKKGFVAALKMLEGIEE